MLTSGRSLRFNPAEIDRHAAIGLDFSQVRSVDQFARAVELWALVMAEVRPDLVTKLERMLRKRVAEDQTAATDFMRKL
ncbi:MAG: hypothetical protein IPI02_18510 [Sterolibacteriaceae bacterium]|nr:hypothetical protein [Sterolibacteriaceae bacterium]